MFHSDYKQITDKLPVSIKNRVYQQFLNHSHNFIPLKTDFKENKCIEKYL